MSKILVEDSRNDLVHKSKTGDNYEPDNRASGKNRFQRRLKSRVSNSVREFNSMDMNKVFKQGIIEVTIRVNGETDMYLVKVSFDGFVQALARRLPKDATEDDIEFKIIWKALLDAFNHNDVRVHCTCPDWRYRLDDWAHRNGTASTELSDDQIYNGQNRPAEKTNPNDTKGAGCKHINLVLSNTSWMVKVASVIRNYIFYMKEHYAKLYANVIYPAIFERKYEEPVQMDMFNDIEDVPDDYLFTDEDTIDTSNKWARTKSQIKPGWNKNISVDDEGEPQVLKGQQSFDIDSLNDEDDIED